MEVNLPTCQTKNLKKWWCENGGGVLKTGVLKSLFQCIGSSGFLAHWRRMTQRHQNWSMVHKVASCSDLSAATCIIGFLTHWRRMKERLQNYCFKGLRVVSCPDVSFTTCTIGFLADGEEEGDNATIWAAPRSWNWEELAALVFLPACQLPIDLLHQRRAPLFRALSAHYSVSLGDWMGIKGQIEGRANDRPDKERPEWERKGGHSFEK